MREMQVGFRGGPLTRRSETWDPKTAKICMSLLKILKFQCLFAFIPSSYFSERLPHSLGTGKTPKKPAS
jgi:hypothetical protein